MDPLEDLESDLHDAIAAARGDQGAADLADSLLKRDSSTDRLIGLQHNCSRAIFDRPGEATILDIPVTSSGSIAGVEYPVNLYGSSELRAWILEQEWSWIHPRFRWLFDYPENVIRG